MANMRPIVLVSLSGVLYGLLGYTGISLVQQHFTLAQMLFWRFFIVSIWLIALPSQLLGIAIILVASLGIQLRIKPT
jgi:hypothetical protein